MLDKDKSIALELRQVLVHVVEWVTQFVLEAFKFKDFAAVFLVKTYAIGIPHVLNLYIV